ncbi:hypothetical protein CL81_gp39 [Mycobacterium phage Charlie]|uniref:Uncharacterized protein n=1 Tax=Mycobacterium phage Charlie TaxID=1056830 RepID=G1FTX7_9CAUD|nr:hypothetical protein CL81_gp39 [Mycobacterium phage Charlie]AEL19961.1 hypothetical protein CHARLIE_39 [Mycobacterium phage Charlie]
MIAAIAGLLRGGADFCDAVEQAWTERRKGFAARESGDFLDVEDLNLARSSEPQSPVPPGYPKWVRDAIDASFEMIADAAPSLAGTHASTPNQVNDSELLLEAAAWIESLATVPYPRQLIADLRDRATQFAALEATTDIPQEK